MFPGFDKEDSKVHERNIDELIRRYSKEISPEEIRKEYLSVLSQYESRPKTIKQYLGIIIMRRVEEALKNFFKACFL